MARVTKLLATAAAVATVLGMASGAHAAIVATSSANIDFNQDIAATAIVSCNLEAPNRCDPLSGVTITPNGAAFFQTAPQGGGAVPPGDNTTFLTIVGGSSATLTAVGQVITGLSFFLGSPDDFNAIQFFSGALQVGPTFHGNELGSPYFAGLQSIGERVTFTGLAGLNIDSVVFSSPSTAMEIDRIFVATAPVPEPATWAMMILGMGMVGMGLRLRRRPATVLAA
jgi:hypothetical protein